MNRKIFLALSALILVLLVVSACGPSQAAIEEAIAQTETARPTATHTVTVTPKPTSTPTPTVLPTRTNTPTPTVDVKATQLYEASLKTDFSNDMKALLESKYGCVLANWKDSSFELVCAQAIGFNDPEQLVTLAYTFTYVGGLRLVSDGLTNLFVPDFSYVVIIMSDDGKHAVRATTDGNAMMLIANEKITSQLEWEVYATIEEMAP